MTKKRAEKVQRRKKRAATKRTRSLDAARKRREAEQQEDAEERAVLEPLGALLAGGGPLAAARFDVSGLPAEPGRDPAQTLAEWFLAGLPGIATDEWRARAKAAVEALKAEAYSVESHGPNPDVAAIDEALFWLEDSVSTGLPALENTLFRFVFERTCEAEGVAGRLPPWVGEVFGHTAASAKRQFHDWRRDRAAQRLTFGPFTDDLAVDDMPAARALITGPDIEPAALSTGCIEAAEEDLTPERRAAAARRLGAAAHREEQAAHPLAAFDLRTLEAALESDDPLDLGLSRLYYTRSVYRRREDATTPDSVWPA